MSRISPLGPPRTSHPLPPAPSRPVLRSSGAAPLRGGLRLLAARLLAEQIERMSRADARLERRLAAALREATVRGVARAGAARRARGAAAEGAWPRAEDFARILGLESGEVRDLIRFDRTLAALPKIAEAYDAGALPRAKLLALLPIVTPDMQDLWLSRAARYEAAALGAYGSGVPAGAAAGPGAAPPAGDEFPVWMDATAAVREALRPLGPGTDPAQLIEGRFAEPSGEPAPGATLFDAYGVPDPAHRETLLRHLVSLRQSIEWRLGRLLAAVRRHSLHLDLGFVSLESWGAAAPGLAPQRIGSLVALDAALQALPATADAWRRGRITWTQARLIARAAVATTERDWLRLAAQAAPERLAALVQAAAPVATGSPRTPAPGRSGPPGGTDPQPAVRGARGITIGAPLSGSRRTSTSVS